MQNTEMSNTVGLFLGIPENEKLLSSRPKDFSRKRSLLRRSCSQKIFIDITSNEQRGKLQGGRAGRTIQRIQNSRTVEISYSIATTDNLWKCDSVCSSTLETRNLIFSVNSYYFPPFRRKAATYSLFIQRKSGSWFGLVFKLGNRDSIGVSDLELNPSSEQCLVA